MIELLKRCLCLCSLVLGISSCGVANKDSYIESFDKFVEDFELSDFSSTKELTSVKKKYLDFTETYYNKFESELTSSDKSRIQKLKFRYYKALAKYEMEDVDDTLKDFKEKANEFINNILEPESYENL